jgi:hypothetical protein
VDTQSGGSASEIREYLNRDVPFDGLRHIWDGIRLTALIDSGHVHPKRQTDSPAPTRTAALHDDCAGKVRGRAVVQAGSEKFLAAAAVLAGLRGAVRPDSRAAARVNRDVRAAEAAALRANAIHAGFLLDGAAFERTWTGQGQMGGSENDIWYDAITGRVWKRNRIDTMHVSWRQFFDRMLRHNAFFPEALLRLEGFADSDAGDTGRGTRDQVRRTPGKIEALQCPARRAAGRLRAHRRSFQGLVTRRPKMIWANAATSSRVSIRPDSEEPKARGGSSWPPVRSSSRAASRVDSEGFRDLVVKPPTRLDSAAFIYLFGK